LLDIYRLRLPDVHHFKRNTVLDLIVSSKNLHFFDVVYHDSGLNPATTRDADGGLLE